MNPKLFKWYLCENVGAARSFMTLVNDAPEADCYENIPSKMRVLSDPEYYSDESETCRKDRIAFLLNRK